MGYRAIADGFVKLVSLALGALTVPVREAFNTIGNSLVTGMLLLSVAAGGIGYYYVESIGPGAARFNNAKASEIEQMNAIRALEVASKSAKVREFSLAAVKATADGIVIQYAPVPDSKALVLYWDGDAETGLYTAPLPTGAVGHQTVTVPAATFGSQWVQGRVLTVWLHQELSIAGIGLIRNPHQFSVRVP